MRLLVDPDRCRGHGQCALAAPHVVTLNAEGRAQVPDGPLDPARADEARDAELLCPEEALTLADADG